MNKVKNSSKEDQEIVVNILLLAFSSDPFQRYLMPDPSVFFKIQRYGLTMLQVNLSY